MVRVLGWVSLPSMAPLQATRRALVDLFRSLRVSSARLYLISDSELFLMLTQARTPEALQPSLCNAYCRVAHFDLRTMRVPGEHKTG